MKKIFFIVAILSGLLLNGCGTSSKDSKGKVSPAPSNPYPIQTEATPPVVVEKPILPTLEPFDLIVHRVKDIVTIKIKKSVELPEGVNHTLVIKRHKIGQDTAKTQYTVHIDVALNDHPKAVIERLFDGQPSLHIEYPLSQINYDDKGNMVAMQSDTNTLAYDEMLGDYDPRTHQQLLKPFFSPPHSYFF